MSEDSDEIPGVEFDKIYWNITTDTSVWLIYITDPKLNSLMESNVTFLKYLSRQILLDSMRNELTSNTNISHIFNPLN